MTARRISGERPKLYTTGDVSRLMGVPISTQKEWERSGFLPPNCEPGRRRKYCAEDIKRLIQVQELTDRYRFKERVLAAMARGEAVPSRLPAAFGGPQTDSDELSEDTERLLDLAARNAGLFADQRRLVKELEATEGRYRILVDHSPDIILRFDSQGTVTFVNPSVNRYGLSPEQIIGRSLKDIVGEDKVLVDRTILERVLRGEVAEALLEAQANTPDGQTVFFAVTAVTLFENGQAIGVLAFARDITKRKRIEADLKRYKLLFDRAQDIVLFVGLDGQIFDANEAAGKAYGFSKPEVVSMSVFDLQTEGNTSFVSAQMAESDAKGTVFETSHRRKDGTAFPVEVSSIGTTIEGERVLLSIIRDITGRKKAEAELRRSERLFRTVFEESPVGIGLTDLDGRILAGNEAIARTLGYSIAEIIELGVEGITVPEDYAKEQREFEKLVAGLTDRFQIRKRYICKDGTIKDVMVTVSLAASRGDAESLAIAVIEELAGSARGED